MADAVDQLARDRASQTEHALNNHKMVTDLKLTAIAETVDEMKAQQKWFIGLVVMLFISTLTWSLAQQYNANEAQKKDMQQQLELLKEQERARNSTRSEILSRLPPGGSEAAGAASGVVEGRDLDRGGEGDRAQH